MINKNFSTNNLDIVITLFLAFTIFLPYVLISFYIKESKFMDTIKNLLFSVLSIILNVFVFLCTVWFIKSAFMYNVFVAPSIENIMNGMKTIYKIKKCN